MRWLLKVVDQALEFHSSSSQVGIAKGRQKGEATSGDIFPVRMSVITTSESIIQHEAWKLLEYNIKKVEYTCFKRVDFKIN